jgi:hypothetical protein
MVHMNQQPRVEPRRAAITRRSPVAWTHVEYFALRSAVEQHGSLNWSAITAELAQFGRTARQYRERWNARLTVHPWSAEEDEALVMLRGEFMCGWTCIRSTMPWRSNADLKKRFARHCRRAPGRYEAQPSSAPSASAGRLATVAACLAMCAPLDMEL